ncbi:thiamine phosphate synthase [Flavobacterium enshiense]|uniref:thiamine phosphate synthase n=1 Tax=Flavobacterium enshiense TaxID=1341165 RepID=UPI00345D6058
MIVITNPTTISNEIKSIHSFFEEGLMRLHIRKPGYSETEMRLFVSAIGLEFANRLVLHSYHHLAEAFEINHIHFPERDRPHFRASDTFQKSTSVHSMENFNALSNDFDYAFLSPVYPSISKIGYRSEVNLTETIKKRTNFKTKLVALGGIDADNIQQTLENGFDDVALLGTIWNSNNPLENFKKCKQIVHSF